MDAHSVFCARKNGGQCDCGYDALMAELEESK